MKRLARLSTSALLVLTIAACGDDDDDGDDDVPAADAATADAGEADAPPVPIECETVGGAACFELPVGAVAREDGAAAIFDCAPPAIVTSTADIAVSGVAWDFQNADKPIPGATIDAFDDLDFSAPVATATADTNGAFSLVLPAGMAKSRMNWRTSATGWLDTYAVNFGLDVTQAAITDDDRRGISEITADGIAAFIQVFRTPELGVLAGGAVDCERETLKNVIATVSSTSSAGDAAPGFVPGPQVYYFSGGSPNFPVRRTSPENKATKGDGLFVIVEIPPTSGQDRYFLQTWGFKSEADVAKGMAGLSLLSELESPVVGNSVISVEMSANQGEVAD